MRVPVNEVSGDLSPASSTPSAADPIGSLLKPFLDQSASIRSIIAVGCRTILEKIGKQLPPGLGVDSREEALLLQPPSGESCGLITGQPEGHSVLDSLARARKLSEPPGLDLLMLPADALSELLPPVAADFGFRAVAALFEDGPADNPGDWRLRRSLFDRGLICIGSVPVAEWKAFCFFASDAVQCLNNLVVEPRGHIGMSELLQGAGFANQLFRYACAKLYALRHGLTPAFPAWPGQQLFGLEDRSYEGLNLPQVSYPGFAENDREIWERDEPSIDIDLWGYFQEIPECWRRHRPLLRRMFQLAQEHLEAIDAWRDAVTGGGRRTLVAVHIRRGDYPNLGSPTYFRVAPVDWYLDWLRTIWPRLREPVLFVGTDEPDTIVPQFREFETVSAAFGPPARRLPGHVRDFEVMRRADYLAICNSSFSRMAAILAKSTQKCFLVSFGTRSFEPYQPWIDPRFWARFAIADPVEADSKNIEAGGGTGLAQPSLEADTTVETKNAFQTPVEQATLLVDVSDLIDYLLDHPTISGIQRVQCEILRHTLDLSPGQPLRFVVLRKSGRLGAIDIDTLLGIVEDMRSGAMARESIDGGLRELLYRASPCGFRARDVFLTLGAFWAVRGMETLLQTLKNTGVIIGVFIHDMLPLTAPEYFETRAARRHVKGVTAALTFADFILTTSEYNKKALAEYMAARKLDAIPVRLAPLGHDLPLTAPAESKVASAVAGMLSKDYVLCVGTIEARKNPIYLFNVWKTMVRSGRADIPYLVFAGRKGWLVQDFMDQLRACNYLDDRIVVLHNVTDLELELLYRKCLLTAFPSFVEGWGLPVGESLTRGKICLASATGGAPEAGGEFADYIDPYSATDGLTKLLRYLDDPELRRSREREIANRFEPRTWLTVADELLRSTQDLARQVSPSGDIAAITLPPDRFIPISGDGEGISTDRSSEILSPELICLSGWHTPESSGVRAAQPEAAIRFRTEAPAGSRINLLVRLAAHGGDFRIRMRSGSGAESETSLTAGSEEMAVLACEVGAGRLVLINLSMVGSMSNGGLSSYWMLKGVLYFDPKRLAGIFPPKLKPGRAAQPRASSQPAAPGKQVRPQTSPNGGRLLLRSTWMDDSRRAASLGAFLETADSYWISSSEDDRDAPIFADRADLRAFYSGCGNRAHIPKVGGNTDYIRVIRRSNQFVSMSRFSEGSVFDRSGVSRGFEYLQKSPHEHAPWVSGEADRVSIAEETLSAAPYYEGTYLIFYNGNLHNYYHWLVEGLLGLDILSQALGRNSGVKIVLPQTMDIAAVLDHRGALPAVGLGGNEIVEVAASLVKVQEAIWIHSDQVEYMPGPHLKEFQKRVAAMYADVSRPRKRRLLVARKGPARTIHNIEQLQAFLSKYDFETVYLEGLSMVDQILLFQSAEFVISPHGAGLANLLFCEPGTKVIELMPYAELRQFFWLISDKLDLVHGMQFCNSVGGQDFQSPIHVDIGKLEALIRMVNAHL